MKLLVPLSFFFLFLMQSCAVNKTTELTFLVGTWKQENKELYEVWQQSSPHELKGYSYKMDGNQKSVTETLTIRQIKGQVVYEATVPNQNEGKTIRFVLHRPADSLYSFENPVHDFPRKIQYKVLDADRVKVQVLGAQDQGFSYIQKRWSME